MDNEAKPNVETKTEERKIDVLEVLMKKCTGTVKWYSHKLLYGFISRKDNQEDVFVHRTAIANSTSRTPNLRNGEEVEFSVVQTTNGIEAYNVTGPDGGPVQGFQLIRRRRRPRRDHPSASGDAENDHENENDAKIGGEDHQRRRPRRGRGGGIKANGDANGTQSEGDVYYEPGDDGQGENSPEAGEQRRIKRGGGPGYGRRGRGGFRGGRGPFRGPISYGYRGGRGGIRGGKRGGAASTADADA